MVHFIHRSGLAFVSLLHFLKILFVSTSQSRFGQFCCLPLLAPPLRLLLPDHLGQLEVSSFIFIFFLCSHRGPAPHTRLDNFVKARQ